MQVQELKTLAQVAEAMGVHIQAVHYWRKEGCPGKVNGRYDLEAIKDWHEKNILQRKHGGPETLPEGSEKSKLLRAQRMEREAKAAIAQRDYEILCEKYRPVDEIKQRDVERIGVVRNALLSMPRRLGQELEGLTAVQIEVMLRKRFRELLERFAKM